MFWCKIADLVGGLEAIYTFSKFFEPTNYGNQNKGKRLQRNQSMFHSLFCVLFTLIIVKFGLGLVLVLI
jgi:hypothetical protein